MAITMIDPVEVSQKPFEDSHLFTKLRRIILVARTVGANVKEPTYLHSVETVELDGEIYDAVKADYDLVRETLLDPKRGFDALKSEMGVYIQPRTKGRGHGSTSRAFYARKKFLSLFISMA